jgi:hypothetical protein
MKGYGSSMYTEKYQGKPSTGFMYFFDQMQKSPGVPTWSHEKEHECTRSAHPGERRQAKNLHQAG